MGLSKNDDNLYFNMSSILGFEKEWLNTRQWMSVPTYFDKSIIFEMAVLIRYHN